MERKATFGAGCFWGVEVAFRQVPGVTDAVAGYLGGTLPNPTYKDVCTGQTGHAEVVEVTYDPDRVPYDDLLNVFWTSHDPTTLNRQGPDVGTQYRSAIFYHDENQRQAAVASKEALSKSGRFPRPIVTEITPTSTFYRAEEYHQRYLEKRGLADSRWSSVVRSTPEASRPTPSRASPALSGGTISTILLRTAGLLALSNVFMTFAWYAHLRNMSAKPWWVAAFAMLALSSLSKSSRYVAILFAGVIFFTKAIFGAMYAITGGSAWVVPAAGSTLSLPAGWGRPGAQYSRRSGRAC